MGLPNQRKPENETDSWIQEERLALGYWLKEAEQLVTHADADLDALFSLVLAQLYRTTLGKEEIPVAFVPGSVRDLPKGTVALDVGVGRGIYNTKSGGALIKASVVGSACLAILRLLPHEEYDILKTMVSEISKSDEDSRGRNTAMRTMDEIVGFVRRMRPEDRELHSELRSMLNTKRSTLFCTSIYDMFQSLRSANTSDQGLYSFVYEWVQGTLLRGRRRRFLRTADEPVDVVKLFNGRLAVLPLGGGVDMSKLLEKLGAELTLYCRSIDESGKHWTMVLHRAPDSHINLEKLFGDRMNDFDGICIKEFLVGWTAEKGGGVWLGGQEDIHQFRDRFIERVIGILEPWMASPRH